jgi:16S rRNA (cytidine1402-2'-O)-methyltransferase
LVRAATAQGFDVEVVPGPSAAIAALIGSGLPTGRFVFEGFLPRKASSRAERLRALGDDTRTIVLYEAPHRLVRTLTDLLDAIGPDRRIVLAREMTKLHEEFIRGSLRDVLATVSETEPRGEYVVVVDGAPEPADASDDEVLTAVREALARGLSPRDAAAEVADRLGVPKRRAYSLATVLAH